MKRPAEIGDRWTARAISPRRTLSVSFAASSVWTSTVVSVVAGRVLFDCAYSISSTTRTRIKPDYDAMKQQTGAQSVQASREVEALKNSANSAQTKQGVSRLGDLAAKTKNV